MTKLGDGFARTVYFARVRKKTLRAIKPIVPTTPGFIFGAQRSGTNMLIGLLQLHPETEVYEERPNNEIYDQYRIRNLEIISNVLKTSRGSLTCFKAICDSHIVHRFVENFPDARLLWITRRYADVANSRLRKFISATRPIKIVCSGGQGGGWFQEGVSEPTASILRDIYSDKLTDFDLACLAWWARNRIFIEQKLYELPNMMSVRYEDVVTDPAETTKRIFAFLELPYLDSTHKHLFQTSIRKHDYPELNPRIRRLCDELQEAIDLQGRGTGLRASRPPAGNGTRLLRK